MMDLKGKWKGFYEYGVGYTPPQFGKRVNFYVTLIGDNSEFEGFCVEEESEFSIPENSKIRGFVEDNLISYVKTYQNFYEIDENYQLKFKKGKEMEVNYEGEYSEEFDCLFGEWSMESQPFEHEGEIVQAIFGGIWQLERDPD